MTRRNLTEPACRVCGCTEHNACDEGCSWVRVERGSAPLCSACDGTSADFAEVLSRIDRVLCNFAFSVDPKHTIKSLRSVIRAAAKRRKMRIAMEDLNPDPAWGNR